MGACGGSSANKGATSFEGLTVRNDIAFAGIADHTLTHGDDCVGDVNGDGYLDVLLNNHTDQWKLFYGSASGKFTPAPIAIPRRDRHGCVFADFNGDGRLDVYFAIGACMGKCRNAKELWIQQPNHTFVNEASQWAVDDPNSRGRVPIAVNANGDNRPDLFTGSEAGVDFPSPNKLWINEGNHFVLHNGPPTLEIGDRCSAAADLTHDGLDDIAVCVLDHPFHLYRALGNGNYVDATASFGLATFARNAVRFADVNHDGWPDLVSVSRTRVTVQLNDHGHFGKPTFSVAATAARDAAVGDVDGDGNLDLYVLMQGTNKSHPDQIYLGDGTGHFTLAFSVPARRGVGESVTVLPHWRDGRDAFIVNNGWQYTRGDRQLIDVVGNRVS